MSAGNSGRAYRHGEERQCDRTPRVPQIFANGHRADVARGRGADPVPRRVARHLARGCLARLADRVVVQARTKRGAVVGVTRGRPVRPVHGLVWPKRQKPRAVLRVLKYRPHRHKPLQRAGEGFSASSWWTLARLKSGGPRGCHPTGKALQVFLYPHTRAVGEDTPALSCCACSKSRSSHRIGFSFVHKSFSLLQSMLSVL